MAAPQVGSMIPNYYEISGQLVASILGSIQEATRHVDVEVRSLEAL